MMQCYNPRGGPALLYIMVRLRGFWHHFGVKPALRGGVARGELAGAEPAQADNAVGAIRLLTNNCTNFGLLKYLSEDGSFESR